MPSACELGSIATILQPWSLPQGSANLKYSPIESTPEMKIPAKDKTSAARLSARAFTHGLYKRAQQSVPSASDANLMYLLGGRHLQFLNVMSQCDLRQS